MSAFPIILSSPSGAGKTSIAKALLERRADLGYSISCTTRSPRPGEKHGVDYYFVSKDEFVRERDAGAFAEFAEVHGNLYGTRQDEIDRVLGTGRHVMMDVDVQGAQQLRRVFPSVVTIFVLPPSADVLLDRLRKRKTESREQLVSRLRSALHELSAITEYEYIVVNDDLEESIRRVGSIIDAEVSSRERVAGLENQVTDLIHRLESEIHNQSG
jgi:guanylate kinase